MNNINGSAPSLSDLAAYDYVLPPRLIAQSPAENRTDSRLMLVDRRRNVIEHLHVRDLPDLLRPEDALVCNDTKVVPARLIGRRTSTGGAWEGLFLHFDGKGVWEVMSKTRGKLRTGETITLQAIDGSDCGQLEIVGRTDSKTLLVRPLIQEDTFTFLERVGRVPIPPYIRSGKMVESDRENYQTVYADKPGAVAAPTAGLHFTKELLETIRRKGVAICPVTLHVGAGTFKPITVDTLVEHHMHSEFADINAATVATLTERRRNGGRIVAVGTTSVRVLESASNVLPDGKIDSTGNNQLGLVPFTGPTDLFIRPPYQFKTVDVLMTNFHLPKSTLIVLVRTFGGHDLLKRAYQEAIENEYRFYSYGDAMIIV